MTKYKQFYLALEAAGHVLIRDERGEIDCWVVDYDIHNGPGCSVCGMAWCEHCKERITPCTGIAK